MKLHIIFLCLVLSVGDYAQSIETTRYVTANELRIYPNPWFEADPYQSRYYYVDKIYFKNDIKKDSGLRVEYTIDSHRNCFFADCWDNVVSGSVSLCAEISETTQDGTILYLIRKLLGHLDDCPIKKGTVDVRKVTFPEYYTFVVNTDNPLNAMRIQFKMLDVPPRRIPNYQMMTGTLTMRW